ncbi:MAG: Gmad2 immunoglobulin-like domain-containing protein [Acidimicrobiia bacterium]|nr:Gmad2 immunoglobulin-like domain-containing protein [Acidimicrobiia bacterium]
MSEDRLDPRVRELTYRLMEMAPDAPPFPEEAIAMSVPVTKQRPPMLVWAAAAAAVVLLVGLPLLLFRGGDEPTAPATTIAAPDTTTTTVVDEPTTTMAPTTVAPGVPTVVEFNIYVFSEAITTYLGDPALVPLQLEEEVPSEPGSDTAVGRWDLALDALFDQGPTFGAYWSAIPELSGEWSGSLDGSVLEVDLPAEFEAGGGTMMMTSRLAQVVFTATQFDGIDSVLFKIAGEVVEVFSGEGIILDGPQTRMDYVDILPLIFLDEPAIGSRVSSPATLSGIANVFEATVQFEIVNESGNLINADFTTATCGTGCWGEFSAQAPFFVPEETPGEIVVYEEAALDGSRVNEIRYPVTLLPGGEEEPPTTTTLPTTDTTLPGEAFDIGPTEGDVVAVIGVAHDDVLNLRDGPGVGYEPLLGLNPLADDLVATGRHRLLESSIWTELTADGVTGWVNSSYIGYLGGVDDLTSFVVSEMGGIPEAETMLDLGTMVAESFGQDEGGFRYEMVIPPTVGDLGEVTFDVVGLLDDAQRGWRLHIFGQPTEGGEGFSLKSVEGMALCGRGVTEDGLCI